MKEAETDQMTVEQWLAIRKEAALKIDPDTAEVDWTYGLTLDPYGVYPDLPEEYRQVGREYFACSPGSDIWVELLRPPGCDPRRAVGKAQTKVGVPRWISKGSSRLSGQNNP